MPQSSAIYLDYAAATPVDPEVLRLMQPYFAGDFYNPSATYLAAVDTRKSLEAARGKVAHWLGSRPAEIIFTAGGTEANNLAIHGVMRQFPNGNIVTSSIEHESVLVPAGEYVHRQVAVLPNGTVDLEDLAAKIDDQTVLVSIMYANNEIGTVQSLRKIAQIIAEKRRARKSDLPLYFQTDACQAANYLDLHVARLGVDMMTLNGGKIYGPKQSGVLYLRGGIRLQPLISGGGQEHGLRSGTENVAAAIGFAAALELAQAMRQAEVARLQALQADFIDQISTKIPTAVLNGSRKNRLPNNIHVTIPGTDNERLLILLDEAGIQAAAGSACSASDEEPSHVLRALGLTDQEAQASLRFTMGRSTTDDMITTVVEKLTSCV